jgi:hypothetical protein
MSETRPKRKLGPFILFAVMSTGIFYQTPYLFGASCDEPQTSSSKYIWYELILRMPYPHSMPLPPPESTPIDGTYAKRELKEEPPVHCRRCPDYAVEGGIWKVHLDKGVFRIFHGVTGWKSIASFVVSGEELLIANDPVCQEVLGRYTWKLQNGQLILKVIEDSCAIGLRAKNLSNLPWLSCQPPNREAAITDHWPKPPGCAEE